MGVYFRGQAIKAYLIHTVAELQASPSIYNLFSMGKSTPTTSWGHQRYMIHLLQCHFRQLKTLFLPLWLSPSVSSICRICGTWTWLAHENTLSEVWDNSRAPRGGTAAVRAAMHWGHGRMLTVSGGPEAGDTDAADLRLSGGAAGVCTGRDPLHIWASSPLPSVSWQRQLWHYKVSECIPLYRYSDTWVPVGQFQPVPSRGRLHPNPKGSQLRGSPLFPGSHLHSHLGGAWWESASSWSSASAPWPSWRHWSSWSPKKKGISQWARKCIISSTRVGCVGYGGLPRGLVLDGSGRKRFAGEVTEVQLWGDGGSWIMIPR